MIHRRALIIATTALLTGPLIAHGQQAVKMYRIGWLIPGSASPEAVRLHDAFRGGLRDFGYLEGRDYVIEFRWAHGHTDQLHGLAAQLVSLGVDVIVAVTSHTAHAAKQATSTIPILLITPDPLSTGLATNLARPEANVTGVTMIPGREIVGKYVQIMQEAIPAVSRVVVLWSQTSPWQSQAVADATRAGQALGLRVQPVGFASANDFERLFAAMVTERTDGVIILPDATTFVQRKRLIELVLRHRLPALLTWPRNAVTTGRPTAAVSS